MGLFGKNKAATRAHKLKTGASIPMTDVDPGFIEWARQTKPSTQPDGHLVTVKVELVGNDIVAVTADGTVVARMDPIKTEIYRDEFQALRNNGEYGLADIAVSPAGKRERVGLLINYDYKCRDGGIL